VKRINLVHQCIHKSQELKEVSW